MSVAERTRARSPRSLAPFRRADGTPWGFGFTRFLSSLRQRPATRPFPVLVDAIGLGCLAVLVATGVLLAACYTPSSVLVVYHGSYPLLRGIEMSEAYASILRLSFDLPGGLLLRQAHHWAGLMLPAALMVRLLLAFFTGDFRKPRRAQWLLLVGAFLAAMTAGWSGYALPDDLLAGTGLRIFHGVLLGIPIIGTWLSLVVFNGEYPGEVLARLYPIHVIFAPVALVLLLAATFGLAARARSPQPSTSFRSERRFPAVPWWPTMAAKCVGMFMITIGLVTVFGGLVEISPVWRQGPSSPNSAGAGSQPDWYTAFLDGALRLVPSGWELDVFGRTVTLAVIVPLTVIGLFFLAIVAYPLIEQRLTGDHAEHHTLVRPRDASTRTGVGVAGLVFYCALWAAGSADIIATQFEVSFNAVITVLQVTVLVGPPLAFLITRTGCRTLLELEGERLRHGAESGVIIRLPNGGYVEVHRPPTSRVEVTASTPPDVERSD